MSGLAATEIRKKLAGQAQIKDVKFWAVSASDETPQRRIAHYTGIGVTGAITEDLGRDARVEVLEATVTEDVYTDLKFIETSAEVVTIVHPLFGAFEGRLASVKYTAGPQDMLDIKCICIEHGDPQVIFAPAANTTAQNKASADSAFDDLTISDGDNSTLSDLGDYDGATGLPSAATGMSEAYSAFSAVMDDVATADGLWTDAAAAFTEFADSAGALIDAIEGFDDATYEMIQMVDTTYDLINIARDWVDSVERQSSSVWQNFQVRHPVSLAEVARGIIGDDSDDIIDLILDRNPTLVDICAIGPGVAISVPVKL